MAVTIRATCSECYHEEELDLGKDLKEIHCSECGHSVPMFADEDFREIETEQKKRNFQGYLALGAFGVLFFSFLGFIHSMDVYTILPESLQTGETAGSGMIIMSVLMGLSFLATLVLGCMASGRKWICEF